MANSVRSYPPNSHPDSLPRSSCSFEELLWLSPLIRFWIISAVEIHKPVSKSLPTHFDELPLYCGVWSFIRSSTSWICSAQRISKDNWIIFRSRIQTLNYYYVELTADFACLILRCRKIHRVYEALVQNYILMEPFLESVLLL